MRRVITGGSALVLAGSLALSMSACSTSRPDSQNTTVTTAAPEIPATPTPEMTPTVKNLAWTTVGTWNSTSAFAEMASGDFVVLKAPRNRSISVMDSTAERELFSFAAPSGLEISDVLLDGSTLVAVSSDPLYEVDDQAVIVDLHDFSMTKLPTDAPQPRTGLWSLRGSTLTYGTQGPGESYCLVRFNLNAMSGEIVECVPPPNGMNQVNPSPYGLAYSSFDDSRPMSCGHVRYTDGKHLPRNITGPVECLAWDGIVADHGGAIWTEVPDPEEIERSRIVAHSGDGKPLSLGMGSTGSLTWCGDWAWFIGEQSDQLLRWNSASGLEEVFTVDPDAPNVPGISSPSCSGDALSVVVATADDSPGIDETLHVTRM